MTRLALRSSLWLGLLLTGACSGIVGGRCEQGYAPCDDRCVLLASDPMNCGACGHVCALGASCVAGACTSAGDGSVGDAAIWPPDAWFDDRDGAMDDAFTDVDGGTVGSDGGVGDVDAWTDVDGAVVGADAWTDVDGAMTAADAWTDVDGAMTGADAWTDVDAGAGSDASLDPDAGVTACDVGELLCGGTCVRVASDPLHCGSCDTVCAAGEVCSAGVCEAMCPPETTMCGGGCVDLTSDPDHCGGCAITCPTGICADSVCVAPYAGHLVLIGHDYSVHRAAMDGVIAHSVFLTVVPMPQVLRYVGAARPASAAGIDAALASAASRPYVTRTAATPSDVTVGLADADVLLVYPQHGATGDELDALGAGWARAIATFLGRGGVVVVADGLGAPDAGGAARWLDAAGLLTTSGRADASLAIVVVRDPSDAIAVRLPLSYRAESSSVHFIDPSLPVVYGDAVGGVVLHRTVVP